MYQSITKPSDLPMAKSGSVIGSVMLYSHCQEPRQELKKNLEV